MVRGEVRRVVSIVCGGGGDTCSFISSSCGAREQWREGQDSETLRHRSQGTPQQERNARSSLSFVSLVRLSRSSLSSAMLVRLISSCSSHHVRLIITWQHSARACTTIFPFFYTHLNSDKVASGYLILGRNGSTAS